MTGEGSKIPFIALPEVVDDINAWNGNTLAFYEDVLHCISIVKTSEIQRKNIHLTLVNNKTSFGNMTFYVITDENQKKAVYACCDCKPFVPNDLYYDADLLILGLVSDNGILKDGYLLNDMSFKNSLFHLDEAKEIMKTFRIKRMIITHISDYWGKSYADYLMLEDQLTNISFAYDGMEITL